MTDPPDEHCDNSCRQIQAHKNRSDSHCQLARLPWLREHKHSLHCYSLRIRNADPLPRTEPEPK